jgi:hypothetical protein
VDRKSVDPQPIPANWPGFLRTHEQICKDTNTSNKYINKKAEELTRILGLGLYFIALD